MHLSLELPSLDVSLVDGRPQELMLLTLDGLAVEYHAGNSAGVTYTQVCCCCASDEIEHSAVYDVTSRACAGRAA